MKFLRYFMKMIAYLSKYSLVRIISWIFECKEFKNVMEVYAKWGWIKLKMSLLTLHWSCKQFTADIYIIYYIYRLIQRSSVQTWKTKRVGPTRKISSKRFLPGYYYYYNITITLLSLSLWFSNLHWWW